MRWNLRVSAPLADVAAELGIPLAGGRRAARSREGGAVRGARPGACGPASTTRSSRRGTRSPSRASPARRARSTSRQWADLALARGRRAARARRGATAGCSPRARASARTSTPTSTTTRSCSHALLELMQTRFRVERLRAGRASSPTFCWTSSRISEHGGFFFTSHDHERLFHRTKPGHDNATPSGNGVAARRAHRARAICARSRATSRRASAPCGCSRRRLSRSPPGFRRCWRRRPIAIKPPTSVLLAGDLGDVRRVAARAARAAIAPGCASVTTWPGWRSPAGAHQGHRAGNAARWRGCASARACLPPIADFAGIERALEAARAD